MEKDEAVVTLSSNTEDPVVALAFKLEDGQYGQLTYIRVYQGILAKGDTVVNVRTGKKVKIGRLVQGCMPARWKRSTPFPRATSGRFSASTAPPEIPLRLRNSA